ncbi:MAG: hypothetical protein JW891_01410 [Candidatus Lokiarchaeota archaeon]|nr:hypothetical protein [Candidatus Lokiarchaeota archaeon]
MGYELLEKIQLGELSIQDIINTHYERIEETEHDIKSFTHLSKEEPLKKAKQLDQMLKKKIGKLGGLPIAIKDCICVKNSPTMCASRILEGYRPPYNATVVERLVEKEGAICMGGRTWTSLLWEVQVKIVVMVCRKIPPFIFVLLGLEMMIWPTIHGIGFVSNWPPSQPFHEWFMLFAMLTWDCPCLLFF